MNRPTLKEIRDALNKIPEEALEESSIAIDFATTDDADGEFKVIWTADEEKWEKYTEMFGKDEDKVLDKFTKKLNADLTQAKIREDEKGYDEEYNAEGDW